MFAPCINSIKTLFIIPTDAHYYKITGMLKQLKFRNCSEMFRFTPEPKHVGVIVGILIVLIFL
jgi:hypothetical protein